MKARPASEHRIWMAASATGWNEPVCGPELHPLKSSAFHGALLRQPSCWYLRNVSSPCPGGILPLALDFNMDARTLVSPVLAFGGQMKTLGLTRLFLVVLTTTVLAQNSPEHKQSPTQKSDLEKTAVTNLRKLAIGESVYSMSHTGEGFACDPQALTKLEWPDSPTHAKLVEPALLSGTGQYKFSAQCGENSKPAGKLNIFAVPLDPNAHLPTFCATGTFGPFETKPYFATSEFPIRSTYGGTPDSCIASGELLK
jgi:hypothetical protein